MPQPWGRAARVPSHAPFLNTPPSTFSRSHMQNGNGQAKLPRENLWFSSEEEFLADLDRQMAELTRQVRESAAWNEEHPNGQATNTRAPAKRFRLLTAAQLNAGQYETRSLIPGVLAAGQPGGIFGAFKTLKTSIAADLLISLASGTP